MLLSDRKNDIKIESVDKNCEVDTALVDENAHFLVVVSECYTCLLNTSYAAYAEDTVLLCGRRII